MNQTQASREEVKTLAIAVGVREAARKLGLNENTVRQWSSRYKWFKQPEVPKSVQARNGHVTIVTKPPSEALADSLREHSGRSKIALAKASTKAAEHLADSEPLEILSRSRQMKDVAGTASVVHQWEGQSQGNGPIQFNVLAQRAYFGAKE